MGPPPPDRQKLSGQKVFRVQQGPNMESMLLPEEYAWANSFVPWQKRTHISMSFAYWRMCGSKLAAVR
jgi:hypothetical protein